MRNRRWQDGWLRISRTSIVLSASDARPGGQRLCSHVSRFESPDLSHPLHTWLQLAFHRHDPIDETLRRNCQTAVRVSLDDRSGFHFLAISGDDVTVSLSFACDLSMWSDREIEFTVNSFHVRVSEPKSLHLADHASPLLHTPSSSTAKSDTPSTTSFRSLLDLRRMFPTAPIHTTSSA